MVSAILEIANQSQGVAVWGILLLFVIGYMHMGNKIKTMHVYITLKFQFLESKISDLKKEIENE
jgi:hypothetical protein